MVTQTDIAEVVGLDVSSVNKILNGDTRGTFRAETIALVRRTARNLGYKMRVGTKSALKKRVEELESAVRDHLAGSISADQMKKVLERRRSA